MSTPAAQARFSSRWTLILSVLGIAVGTGNIWRFPRIVAQNGGDGGAGGFLVAWLVFLAAWSLPLILAEYALGQRGRRGVIGTFARLSGGRLAWMGAFVAFVASAIMAYYSVVAGWCLWYTGSSLAGGLALSPDAARASWDGFQGSAAPVATHAAMMLAGALAVRRGVASIERANTVLVPVLLAIVGLAFVRAVTLPGAGAGLAYLFTFDGSVLANPRTWLEALTQNAWDTGAGWGLILTYAAYMRREDGLVKSAVLTGVGNNTVSILAAMTVFGIVFAVLGADRSAADVLAVMRDSGPASTGLTFIWMPQLFSQMPFGGVLAVLFFLALTFAALSSLISMIELATRAFVDAGVGRTKAVAGVATAAFLVGVPSALSGDVVGNQDFVWGVALMLSGLFVALVATRYGAARLRAETAAEGDWRLTAAWDVWLRWAIPAQATVLLGWWLYQATTADFAEQWWNPLEPYSAASCLVQWGIVLAVALAANRTLARSGEPYAGDVPGGPLEADRTRA